MAGESKIDTERIDTHVLSALRGCGQMSAREVARETATLHKILLLDWSASEADVLASFTRLCAAGTARMTGADTAEPVYRTPPARRKSPQATLF